MSLLAHLSLDSVSQISVAKSIQKQHLQRITENVSPDGMKTLTRFSSYVLVIVVSGFQGYVSNIFCSTAMFARRKPRP